MRMEIEIEMEDESSVQCPARPAPSFRLGAADSIECPCGGPNAAPKKLALKAELAVVACINTLFVAEG